jgi:moderate conductance mechanosensitive channel
MAVGLAQTPSAPPQPLPQEQFDALVEVVKKAVTDELKAQGAAAAAKPETAIPAGVKDASRHKVFDTFRRRLLQVIVAMPEGDASGRACRRR